MSVNPNISQALRAFAEQVHDVSENAPNLSGDEVVSRVDSLVNQFSSLTPETISELPGAVFRDLAAIRSTQSEDSEKFAAITRQVDSIYQQALGRESSRRIPFEVFFECLTGVGEILATVPLSTGAKYLIEDQDVELNRKIERLKRLPEEVRTEFLDRATSTRGPFFALELLADTPEAKEDLVELFKQADTKYPDEESFNSFCEFLDIWNERMMDRAKTAQNRMALYRVLNRLGIENFRHLEVKIENLKKSDRRDLINDIAGHPDWGLPQCERVIEWYEIIAKSFKGEDRKEALQSISLLTDEEYASAREHPIDNGLDLMSIHELFQTIPAEEKKEVHQYAASIARGQRAPLEAMRDTPSEHRQAVANLLKEVNAYSHAGRALVKLYPRIPESSRENFVQIIKRISSDAWHGEWVLKAFDLLPIERVGQMSDWLASDPNFVPSALCKIIILYSLMPPDSLDQFVESRDFTPIFLLTQEMEPSEEFINDIHQHLMIQLEMHIEDRESLSRLVSLMESQRVPLRIEEDSPLDMKMIEVQSILAIAGSYGPYAIHKKLLEAEHEPLLDLDMPAYPMTLRADDSEATVHATFNLDKVRETARLRIFKAGDIPDEYRPALLKEMFEALETRIGRLADNDKADVQQFIEGSTGASLQMLKAEFLDKSFMRAMMQTYKPNDNVPSQIYKLACLIKSIMQESNDVSDTPLSPMEDRLIKLAASINYCSTGQRDGIDIAYSWLDPELRYLNPSDREAGASTSSPVETIIREQIQAGFFDALAGPAIEKVIDSDFIPQPSHQTEYLGNRIRRQIGYNKELTFDRHSTAIHQRLLRAHPKKLAEAVYETYPFAQLIATVKKAINVQFFGVAVGLDERTLNKIRNDLIGYVKSPPSCFDLDEDTYELKGINERGVLEVMQSLGYISFQEG